MKCSFYRALALFGLGFGLVEAATIMPSAREIGAAGGTYQIVVQADDFWTISSSEPWATVSPSNAGGTWQVNVTVGTNATGEARSAQLSIGSTIHSLNQLAEVGPASLWAIGELDRGKLGIASNYSVLRPKSTGFVAERIFAGGVHTLLLKSDGTLWATGRNNSGQLGDGTKIDRLTPVQVATEVSFAAVGGAHSLIVKTDGSLWGMGENGDGQLGDGTTVDRLLPIHLADDVIAVAASYSHSLFVKSDGTLWATGGNYYGQLGDGANSTRLTPIQVATDVVTVAAGDSHSLFVKNDGTVWAMGYNAVGQLGDGTTENRNLPVQVGTATGAAAVAVGLSHSAILKDDQTLWTFGYGGALGTGGNTNQLSPVQVATGVTAVRTGSYHTCYVKNDGTLWITGDNRNGQLGDGSVYGRLSAIQAATNVTDVAAGVYQTLFRKSDGTIWGMGWGQFGAFGDGIPVVQTAPLNIVSGARVAAAGVGKHSLFVKTDNTLWAMGANYAGQLGNGSTANEINEPIAVANDVASAWAGGAFSLFLKLDGSLWGMGENRNGQLGDGSIVNRSSPVQIASGVTAAAVGYSNSFFVKNDGSLWAMGNNFYGQLGNGTTTDVSTPVQIASEVTSVSTGGLHSLFLKTDGSLWATGYNYRGQLGDGSTTNQSLPVQVATGVTTMSAGGSHTHFVKGDGTLWAMGDNGYGQLGDGTTTYRLNPVQIASGVSSVASGGSHTLFVKTDESLWAMGYNTYGQLGDRSTVNRLTPVQIMRGVSSVSAGNYHSLVIASRTIQVAPEVSWSTPASIVYGVALSATQLAATANVSGSFSYDPAEGTVLSAGIRELTATFFPDDADGYATVAINQTLQVAPAIAQLSLGSLNATYNGSAQAVTVTTLPPGLSTQITYDSVATPPTRVGTYAVEATIVDDNYEGSVSDTFVISKAQPVISWTPGAITEGEALGSVVLNASANVAGSFTYSPAAGTVLSAGETTVAAIFEPDDAVNYVSVATQRTVDVAQSGPLIITPPAGLVNLVGNTISLSVEATGSEPLSYQWRLDGTDIPGAISASLEFGAVTLAQAGRYSVRVSNPVGSVDSAGADVVLVDVVASQSMAGRGYVAGETVTIDNQIVYAGALGGLGWSVLPPPHVDGVKWSFVASSGQVGQVVPVVGDTDLLEWAWITVPASPITFSYTLNAPANAAGDFNLTAIILPRFDEQQLQGLVKPDPLRLTAVPPTHSADSNGDFKISLTELLRVIELYNTRFGTTRTGRYKVQSGTEDGFAPDADLSVSVTVDLATYHGADSNRDGKISLTELLRVIELYNYRAGTTRTGAYHLDPASEDGFATGPAS